jgi:2-octaprenylphenol hydroxylase
MTVHYKEFDVIIVGAGIAGAALACALATSELRVAIVEALPLRHDWPEQGLGVSGFDPRVSALSPTSQQFLQQLEVWPAMAQRRVSPYRQMQVWDGQGTAAVHFSARELNREALGHIVENRITVAALQQQFSRSANVHVMAPAKLASVSSNELTLEDGQRLRAPLLVAADGANSMLRQQAGFALREWDYGQSAIVTTVQHAGSHQCTARQCFLPEGPLAFLPLSADDGGQQLSSIVWSTSPARAKELLALDDQGFAQQLGRAFEDRLGAIEAVAPRYSFPLRQRHAIDYTGPGIALVGDAAHSIHPLAGQGINLGLMDVKVLAEELQRAQRRGLSLGDSAVLARYQRRRKGANLTMMAAMEGLKRLFGQRALSVRWLRNTGMHWLDQSPVLKHQLMRRAMGL